MVFEHSLERFIIASKFRGGSGTESREEPRARIPDRDRNYNYENSLLWLRLSRTEMSIYVCYRLILNPAMIEGPTGVG